MICLSLLAILGAYAPALKSFPSCLSTCGVAAPAGHPVFFGAGGPAGLVRDGGSPACDTEPEGLGLLPFRLGVAEFVFLALRPLGPLQLVLVPVLLSGFDLGRCGLHPWLWLLYFLAGASCFFWTWVFLV